MRHSFAPRVAQAPALWGRYILVKEFCLSWQDTGAPLDMDEIGLVAEMAGIWNEAQRMKNG